MRIDESIITATAKLARLELTPEETAEFIGQLTDIITYVNKLDELDTSTVKPADHIVDVQNVLREDAVKPSLERAAIEAMAPQFADGHIVVPRIIEGGE